MGNKRKPTQRHAGQNKRKKVSKGPKGKGQPVPQNVPLPEDVSDDEQNMYLDEEDVDFVQQYGPKLGFLQKLDAQELNRAVQDKQKAAAAAVAAAANAADTGSEGDEATGSDDVAAAEYERRPRQAEQDTKSSPLGLPVKTPTGEVVFRPQERQQLQAAKVRVEGVTVQDSWHQEEQQRKADKAAAKEAAAAAAEEGRQQQIAAAKQQQKAKAASALAQPDGLPPALLSLMSIRDQEQRRAALKQQMALAAQHVLAEPDKHVGPGLKLLLVCAGDNDGQMVRLALLSLLVVFKDILPGYRIRSLTDEEKEMRVSKEVQALREFEAALLRAYQAYLKTLLAATGPATTGKRALDSNNNCGSIPTARVAVRCMGQLLVSRPGFNYSSDLLQALVPLMASSDAQVQEAACGAIRQLLQEDVQAKTSVEAVQLVADLVRKRQCSLSPRVVGCLLVLQFEQVTPTSQGGEGVGSRLGKKAACKAAKARKKPDLERDFAEAEAVPDVKELALLQSQMLEALFEIFFRVLKHCNASMSNKAAKDSNRAASGRQAGTRRNSTADSRGALSPPWPAAKVHRKFPLLQPVLQGLGRYSHLISVEYFNDLTMVLQKLLASGALPVRERLGVLLAALEILKGQGEALTIDRRAFYSQLYQTLLLVPIHLLFEGAPGSRTQGSVPPAAAEQNGASSLVAQQGGLLPTAEDDTEDLQAMEAVLINIQGWEERPADGNSAHSSNVASSSGWQNIPTPVLLLRCLEQQLLGVKQTDISRLAAFAKRLAEIMLSATTADALGCGCLIWRLVKRYPKLVCQFEWEGGAPVGGRQYDPDCPDPSEASALAAALWELPLLSQHYHPHMSAAARALLALTPGKGAGADAAAKAAAGSVVTGAAGPQQLATTYNAVNLGGFRPAPQVPAGLQGDGRGSSAMAARQAAAAGALCMDLHQQQQPGQQQGDVHQPAQQQQSAKQQPSSHAAQQKRLKATTSVAVIGES